MFRRAALLSCVLLVACSGGNDVTGDQTTSGAQTPTVTESTSTEAETTGPEETEAVTAEQPLTLLLIGIDADSGSQRADVIMLVRIDEEREHLTAMSIPRDLWVEIPGQGEAKINAAYAYGGTELLKETVNGLYDSSIDHTLVVDFEAFSELSTILGPITVETADGPVSLEGDEALSFVRERMSLPGGDFDRVRRQQAFLAGTSVALQGATPAQLQELAQLAGEYIEADGSQGLNSQALLLNLVADVAGTEQTFFTAPHAGTGWSGDGQSIVLVDAEATDGLASAYESDSVSEWIEEADPITLDSSPVN